MDIQNWSLDEVIGRDAYEALLGRLAGDALADQLGQQRAACQRIQGQLSAAQQPLFLTYADAAADHAALREEAVARAGLCLGVGVGAALTRFPEQAPEALMQTAARAVGLVLGASLPVDVADEVARAALGALARLDLRAAA